MILTKMNRFLVILLCIFLAFANRASSQKTYFVYLQSDNQLPFYVILNGKNISSSSIGYVILSKLQDSTYPVRIGFPGSGSAYDFDLKINGTDQGFLIKDFGEKGWGLFNLQTLDVQMSGIALSSKKAAEGEKRTSDSLSQAAILVAAAHKEDSVKAATTQQSKSDSSTTTTLNTSTKPELSAASIKNDDALLGEAAVIAAAVILPAGNSKEGNAVKDSATGQEKPSVDSAAMDSNAVTKGIIATPVIDTIARTDSAVMDTTRATAAAVPGKPVNDSNPKKAAAGIVAVAAAPKFLEMELQSDTTGLVPVNKTEPKDSVALNTTPNNAAKTVGVVAAGALVTDNNLKPTAGLTSNNSNAQIVTVPVKADSGSNTAAYVPLNSACKQTATDKDFFALRKKMAATDDADDMIGIAKKAFKEKCFSTTQVRNLCVLFLDDAGRYNFLDDMYNYTSDQVNYKQLSDLLKDDYYLKRFMVMLK